MPSSQLESRKQSAVQSHQDQEERRDRDRPYEFDIFRLSRGRLCRRRASLVIRASRSLPASGSSLASSTSTSIPSTWNLVSVPYGSRAAIEGITGELSISFSRVGSLALSLYLESSPVRTSTAYFTLTTENDFTVTLSATPVMNSPESQVICPRAYDCKEDLV
ncbi:hypothetical protein V6N12_013005 [Hibiscus sabdariffa]|uniref:Uncharacterized protein n=1 Tax=Hibiscus sabdariffa TaxID=183260 RepID=A0ABR2EHQ6_9ROSI